MPKNVILKGDPIRKEGPAGGIITPGHLIEFDASGDLVVHANAGQNAAPAFAVEQDFLGKTIDDAYADGDRVQYIVARSGDEVYAFLDAGENVAKGDMLESAGNGALQEHVAQAVDEGGAATYTIYNRAIVSRALESIDNGAGGEPVRIKVEVL